MAEGFEPYHVPQQSRRDKLRVVGQSHQGCIENLQGCTGLVSLYDPSMISPDLLTCAASSSSATHHMYMDPQTSIQLNPSSIQDINSNSYLYTPHGLRFLDQSFHGGVAHAANNATDQGLSLSLSSPHPQQSNLPLELNLQRYDSSLFSDKVTGGCVFTSIGGGGGGGGGGDGSTSIEWSRSSVALGPFCGYASILKGSRFLKPAQQLLEELCDVGRGIYVEKFAADHSALMDPPLESLGGSDTVGDPQSCNEGSDGRRKSRLISLLHEVFRRYKQYYQHMQAVVASFESVAGISNATPFANLALKSMYKNFRSLKNAIMDQLQFSTNKNEIPRFGNLGRGVYGQRPSQATGIVEHQPVWRPQRGLPERAVGVLRAWLFEHFLHPYPTDTDKLMLATQTGLSRNQVSNWFINARVRLWKPMVEEIHMLETQQAQRASQRKEHDANRPNAHLTASSSLASENPSSSSAKAPDFPSKRTRNNLADIHVGSEQPMHLSYDTFSHHPHLAINTSRAGGSNSVSLTLGLHQNIGVGLSEPFPVNAARRFGLDANSEGYVVGGFEAQNRLCGRNILGEQLVHDFVG